MGKFAVHSLQKNVKFAVAIIIAIEKSHIHLSYVKLKHRFCFQ